MNTEEKTRIRTSFAAQTMMATFEARIIDIQRGSVSIEAPISPGARQQQGFGHAGLSFSIGDSAAGYAALTTLPLHQEVVTEGSRCARLSALRVPTARWRGNRPSRYLPTGKRLSLALPRPVPA